MELIERIRAVLDEDARLARAAAVALAKHEYLPQEGKADVTSDWTAMRSVSRWMVAVADPDWDRCVADRIWTEVAAHMARHDPARVLRQIAAHRKLLDFYQEADQWYNANRTAPAGEITGLVRAIEFLAEALGITP